MPHFRKICKTLVITVTLVKLYTTSTWYRRLLRGGNIGVELGLCQYILHFQVNYQEQNKFPAFIQKVSRGN